MDKISEYLRLQDTCPKCGARLIHLAGSHSCVNCSYYYYDGTSYIKGNEALLKDLQRKDGER